MKRFLSAARIIPRISFKNLHTSSKVYSEFRPAIDFDYLLDNKNLENVRRNIQ